MTTLAAIDDFLAQKRLAVVGVSRNPKDFSQGLFRELRRRGYDVVPVNPNGTEVEGERCFPRVQDIAPPVDGALLMTPPETTERVVRDCVEAGISRIWMHRGGGAGAVSPQAVALCRETGLQLVPGECPYMFLPGTALIHRVHGWCKRLTGSWPR